MSFEGSVKNTHLKDLIIMLTAAAARLVIAKHWKTSHLNLLGFRYQAQWQIALMENLTYQVSAQRCVSMTDKWHMVSYKFIECVSLSKGTYYPPTPYIGLYRKQYLDEQNCPNKYCFEYQQD